LITMSINKVRALWTNFSGAPGYTTVYSLSPPTPTLGALRGLFDALKAYLPYQAQIEFPNSGDILDEATGTIQGAWSATSVTNVVSTATIGTGSVGPAGACISWRTNNIVNGRRPVGRSYLVPLVVGAFEANCSLNPTVQTAILSAATAAITAAAGGFVVWSRPAGGRPGTTSLVSTATVADVAAVLRSRRT